MRFAKCLVVLAVAGSLFAILTAQVLGEAVALHFQVKSKSVAI